MESTIETEENLNNNISLSMESVIETEENHSNSSSEKEKNDLLFEQNWKNKNIPTKIKRSYLQERPDWNTISIAKNAVGITLLKNGKLCTAISEKKLTYIVLNTCAFDSLVHILASATMFESFNNTLQTEIDRNVFFH